MTFYGLKEQPMTESEWFACTEPAPMLEFLEDKVSNRKMRLLACAVVRHVPLSRDGMIIWELLPRCEWFRSPEFPGVDCDSVIETAESSRGVSAALPEMQSETPFSPRLSTHPG